jgi:choline-glycine betaine transporter
MAYQIQELDPVKELSPTRRRIEFGIVFVLTFLLVRFGGWHHDMDPLSYAFNPPTWVSLLIAAAVSSVFVMWRVWQSTHTAVRETQQN